ncbi:hypothetical protein L249_4946 [Ophiocordyceps polyrhachis-furcata BCC 54312]|uniref:Asteroid domain-containing protein n=1 Tax=Ophiocordyceps polyrhachis-furcata BCC 54312 TaxID=1330021 RepID=A0A367L3J8_9HYPO|nr:hypothetical protein L249_4946 [Ophiocordyceps polyrhachis-furcata BCC 54312]
MGIRNLTKNIQPLGQHYALQDETVVIDGPALAFHILHLCRINCAAEPSDRLIAQSTLKWLNELAHERVTIEAIYFDGHVPPFKRTVRMERLMLNYAELSRLFSGNPEGCPRKQVARDDRRRLADYFSNDAPDFMPVLDPSFFVSAVIDALRQSPRYKNLTSIVPDEADAYCAAHVSARGGLVLTSDSDLLVYELNEGKVAFFRDVSRDSDSQITCSLFSPTQICERLGLPASEGLLRLAYEQKRAPHSTLPELVCACSRPIANEFDYRSFSKQYQLLPEHSLSRALHDGSLTALDTRVSELVVQLSSCPPTQRSSNDDALIMYLPVLMENPQRGTAWEQTTPLRQLAYSLLCSTVSPPGTSVSEYRRIQDVSQRGRRVETIPPAEAEALIDETLNVMECMKEIARSYQVSYWHLICMAVEANDCRKRDKQSLTWHVFQQQHQPSMVDGSRINWDTVHFSAHLQAALFSFRLLFQLLSVVRQGPNGSALPSNARQLWSELLQLPPLARFPDIGDAMRLLLLPKKDALIRDLSKSPHFATTSAPDPEGWKGVKKRAAGRIKNTCPTPSANKSSNSMKSNMFGLLSNE